MNENPKINKGKVCRNPRNTIILEFGMSGDETCPFLLLFEERSCRVKTKGNSNKIRNDLIRSATSEDSFEYNDALVITWAVD